MANEIITVDGVSLPTPAKEGVTVSREKIWSANTGRTAKQGSMEGTVVGTKTTIKVKFPPLSLSKAKAIEKAVDPQWINVVLSKDGETVFSGQCYAGTPTYTVYSMANGMPYARDFSVDLIER